MTPSRVLLKIASSEDSTMAASRERFSSAIFSAFDFCRAMLLMTRQTRPNKNKRRRSVGWKKVNRDKIRKYSASAADKAVANNAGPKPHTLAASAPAAKKNRKGSVRTGGR